MTGQPKLPVEVEFMLMWFPWTQLLVSAFKLNIITVYTGQNPLYGYISTGPAYIAALERAKMIYPDVFHNSTLYTVYYNGGLISCADGAVQIIFMAGNITEILDRTEGFSVIYSSSKSALHKLNR
ncbi:hypothetical protein RvY_13356 [Ramazzottius varieornatus]|uniref:Receptor ligand binding region domain-containing protein n=1 Tax=Ramazzottius varieornatus TaxID=947166 RepID=A0A1D1VPG1_RAMVA|nr:hypothetical protein RvY_13356 [Ramazzottius varieornatus]